MTKEKIHIETGDSNKLDIDYSKLWEIGFRDFNLELKTDDFINETLFNEKIQFPKEKKIDTGSVIISSFLQGETEIDISSSSENVINKSRQKNLQEKFSFKLVSCLLEEEFEFGYESKSEIIIREQLQINALATRNWLNEIYIENFDNEKILIGLLRILGRFNETLVFPQGHTMALAALVHENDEIKELGIRAFENWSSQNSLQVLKKVSIEQNWLKEYLHQVIEDLTEELCPY